LKSRTVSSFLKEKQGSFLCTRNVGEVVDKNVERRAKYSVETTSNKSASLSHIQRPFNHARLVRDKLCYIVAEE
jgi:hypothetical protein